MFGRRFVLLVGILVALNVALWFAAPGLALRRAVVNQLFGPSLVRAQVHLRNGQDWNLDRGVITSVSSTLVTLREPDTRVVQIPISGTTKVIRLGRRLPLGALAPRWHVLVIWPAIGPAESVDVEKIPPARNKAASR